MSSIFYRQYKEQQAKVSPPKVSDERLRQNALSASSGLTATPKDFDWVAKNIPCQAACPAGTDIPAYLEAIAHGDFDRAYRINLRDNVFPAALGRVCTRPCEPACRHGWKGLGESVAICFSKRSAADFMKSKTPVVLDPYFGPSGKSVAVVGGGVAGLAAARELALRGHRVTVFEREAKAGGLMLQGIPHFRLPREVVEREIEQVRLCGVEIKCGRALGAQVQLDELLRTHDAVVLAMGTHKPAMPEIEGAQLNGVRHGLEFLREANGSGVSLAGAKVVVIGGGFTATDCARSAKRLGAASVRMLYRRSEREMYITPGEVAEMKREGIQFETRALPLSFVGGAGRVEAVRFIRTRESAPDEQGRRMYEPAPGSEFDVPADVVLLATGQRADEGGTEGKTADKLFRAGDFRTGPASLIDAIADGKAVASRVDQFLMGEARMVNAVLIEEAESTGRTREMDAIARQTMPELPVNERAANEEVELGLDKKAAQTEASRCYVCSYKFEIDNDLCIYCDRCLKVKPVETCIVKISALEYAPDGRITGYRRSTGNSDYNMLYIDQSQCIRCGACKEVCPVECISLQKVSLVKVNPKELNV